MNYILADDFSIRFFSFAGCPGSRAFRDPGGSSSITRPAKPRTHPGLENRETWGTHSYLILLPKIKDGSGQETWATRQIAHLPLIDVAGFGQLPPVAGTY